MLGAAVPPGLLLLLAGVVAGPEQRFAAGQPVTERIAAVAAALAADQPLPRGPVQPARQRRAIRHISFDRPAFEDRLLGELVGRLGQDVVHLRDGDRIQITIDRNKLEGSIDLVSEGTGGTRGAGSASLY